MVAIVSNWTTIVGISLFSKSLVLKIIACIADKGDRPEQLRRTVNSLIKQCDEVRIYDNTKAINYTDNAKFFYLQHIAKPCYYFCADNDIIYPKDYVQHTIELVEKYRTIITYHGRILKEPVNSYYKGNKVYDFRGQQNEDYFVHVGGTGVMAFRTDDFNPVDIYKSKYKLMSDLVLSLEAKKQGKRIICAAHGQNWIRQQEVTTGIRQMFNERNEQKQIELAKLILE